MIKISVNGEVREVPEGISASALLTNLNLQGQRVALELNQEVVPRSQLEEMTIHAGDRVEIVRAIGGG